MFSYLKIIRLKKTPNILWIVFTPALVWQAHESRIRCEEYNI